MGELHLDQLEDKLRALDITISAKHLARIDAFVPRGTRLRDTPGRESTMKKHRGWPHPGWYACAGLRKGSP